MTAIWRNDGSGWRVLSTSAFPDEATLHTLVEDAPQMLPLSGAANPIILGREVQLGNGYADLIAVEPSGRLCVIEVKLARNSETKRAVIAQVLTYAAYLRGMDISTFERHVLGAHLLKRGASTLASAVAEYVQTGDFNADEFMNGVSESLQAGSFRLVIVLDSAPEELVHLVGYLESITNTLVIDLITVAAYDVDGTRVLVPQRIDTERRSLPEYAKPQVLKGKETEGADAFIEAASNMPESNRALIHQLVSWAKGIEQEGLVRLSSYQGAANRWTLLPRLQPDNVGLITIWNDRGGSISPWRSVFQRRAPATLAYIEEQYPQIRIGQGNYIDLTAVSLETLLGLLTDAYREAAGQEVAVRP
jgi:hypothetical protein